MEKVMFTKKFPFVVWILFLTAAQLACNLGVSPATPDTFATLNSLYTASALTLEALATTTESPTPGLPPPTPTFGESPAAPPPTQTPVPSVRCDAVQFLGDVTYPDGSAVSRNNNFIKTWKLKNAGVCSWTPSYALVFVGGDRMDGPTAVALSQNVNPGEVVELSVTLTAPDKAGNYRGYWKLRNPAGTLFGWGEQADAAFWVDIKVRSQEYAAYHFAENYCRAEWQNNNSDLPCPGDDDDERGFVVKLDSPALESGAAAEGSGLLVMPQDKTNGFISGQYPAFAVQKGDRFRAVVQCEHKAKNCDVVFRLDYRNSGVVKTLASWHEVYEGKYYSVDLDLSALAGKTVKFILFVSANGAQRGDYAVWVNPRIVRQGTPPPTPTPTRTSTPTPTPTQTPPPTPTQTPSPTPSQTPTLTPTPTETPSPTMTPTPTPTATDTPTP